MINNFFKIIHNKYYRFFRFIFFLRYLLAIFIISTAIFLIIPNFFNFEKREKILKNHLLKKYNLELVSYKSIKFNSFPNPSLEINNAKINIKPSKTNLFVKNLKLTPKLISIYNYDNFKTNKIFLKNNNITLEARELKDLGNYLINLNSKVKFENLNLLIENNNNKLAELKKIRFSNFGYKKNLIHGEIFGRNFKIKMNENFDKINFYLINSGFSSEMNLNSNNKNNKISGNFKTKILSTNIKFDFIYDNEKLEISNSYLRNKNLSLNSDSLVVLKPFLNVTSNFLIEDINFDKLKSLDLDKILNSKEVIKMISSKNNLKFFSKKFSGDLIDELDLVVDITYGNVDYKKKFLISNNLFNCNGNINLLEEYPLLYFDCFFNFKNTQKFLKKFSINKKFKLKENNLHVKGSLNILNKKVNFFKISSNKNYKATREDLKYYKETFERIVFDKNFLEIFNFKKIKKFIFEIS